MLLSIVWICIDTLFLKWPQFTQEDNCKQWKMNVKLNRVHDGLLLGAMLSGAM